MRRYLIFVLVLVILAGFASGTAAAAWDVRLGIQQNLPVYVREGVLTSERANQIRRLIAGGEIGVTVIPKGTVGTNYSVDPQGGFHVINNYVLPYGRLARVIDGLIWFTSCDNLFVQTKKIVSAPPAKSQPREEWEAVKPPPSVVCTKALPPGPTMSQLVDAGSVNTGFEKRSVTPASVGPLILPNTADININNTNSSSNFNSNANANANNNNNNNTNNNNNNNNNTNTQQQEQQQQQ